ncbi:MAG: succinate dehydrogenase cytochrome b subunit [Ignavibacteriae bacterium]|jgi:succinate dehydrogenase / fumarate reductase cytochrome b subunit|nr:succinate dehydrogenase [Ignavibacteriota bacterium]NOH00307.1 succinate dehydrogenase cytochrome b subunit [Ignavibacteriota bacterium]
MSWLLKSLNSSVGKKFVMAVTGIGLMLFLLFHLVGNLTLFGGPEAFNSYVATLDIIKPLIRVIEVGLALVFIFHIFNGAKLWIENKKANPKTYAVNAQSKSSTLFSRLMLQTGGIVFIFLVLHLATFWYEFNFAGHAETTSHDYYNIVVEWFQIEWYVGFYILAVIILGFHLNHGFQSAFQTFGWNHKKYFPLITFLGNVYSIIIAVGFALMPIYFYFFQGGN